MLVKRKWECLQDALGDMAELVQEHNKRVAWNDVAWSWQTVAKEAKLGKILAEHLEESPKFTRGVFRSVALFDGFVVKFARDNRLFALREEARLIHKMQRTKWARHFPETYVLSVGKIHALVQKRVRIDERLSRKYEQRVAGFGNQFGLDDVHHQNFGWAGKGANQYPVFIDVDITDAYIATRSRKPWEYFKNLPTWWYTGYTDYGTTGTYASCSCSNTSSCSCSECKADAFWGTWPTPTY